MPMPAAYDPRAVRAPGHSSAMHASAAPPRCYVASALGFTHAGAHYYEHVYLPALRRVVEPVDPWALSSAQEVAEARAAQRERDFAIEIGRRNAEADPGRQLPPAPPGRPGVDA